MWFKSERTPTHHLFITRKIIKAFGHAECTESLYFCLFFNILFLPIVSNCGTQH